MRLNIMKNFFLRAVNGQKSKAGFTLLEALIAIVIVGILAAISAPGWISFTNNQKLRTAQSRIFSAVTEAQSLARSRNVTTQISFRENTQGVVQFAILPTANSPTTPAQWDDPSRVIWQNLDDSIGMGAISPEPAFNRPDADGDNDDVQGLIEEQATPPIRSIVFLSKGTISNNIADVRRPNVTIAVKGPTPTGIAGRRACVSVTTLLGNIRNLNEGDSDACD